MKLKLKLRRALRHISARTRAIIAFAIFVACFSLFGIYYQNTRLNLIASHLASRSLLTPNLCLSFEWYNEEYGACEPQCDIVGCSNLGKLYDQAIKVLSLEDLKLYFGFEEEQFKEPGSDAEFRYQNPVDPNSVANRIFQIQGGKVGQELEHVGRPKFIKSPEELWTLFKIALPRSEAGRIDQFMILKDLHDVMPVAAAVIQSSTTTWQVILNEQATLSNNGLLIGRGSVIHTFVHEAGHVLTLNIDQVNPYVASSSCSTIYVLEGCARGGSYLSAFVREFWPDQYGSSEAPSGDFVEGAFVSGYAADNPVEDMAESWAAFVLFPRPMGTTIAEKKILFFYRYPALIQIRNEIRGGLGEIR